MRNSQDSHDRFRRNGNSEFPLQGRNGGSRPVTSVELNGRGYDPVATAEVPRWKRLLDIACIVLTLPCWLPLVLVVMAVVRLSSPGPIFYRQERVGYRRRRFVIFKFRTMHVDADTRRHEDYVASLIESQSPMVKLDAAGDSRLIRGGRFLRATGLDELPQIFNVVRGDMSLVGPRPCLPSEFERYENWQQLRVFAPPGLTGYWQVNGKNNTTFKEMIGMDIFYVRNMSVWFDLKIMFQTPTVLIDQARKSIVERFGGHSLPLAKIPISVSRNGSS